jgi:dsDNA-specific endonuclease/ATPase MutS2
MVTTKSQHDNSPTTISTANINERHPDTSHVISAIDLTSSTFLSPSPTVSMNNLGQQESLTQSTTSTYLDRSPSVKSQYSNQAQEKLIKSDENKYVYARKNNYQHRVPEVIHNDETEKRKNWFKRYF